MTQKAKYIAVGVLSLFAFSNVGFAAETAKTGTPEKAKEEMMQKVMERGQPSENHKLLEPLVGKWEHTVSWWMDAKAQPEVSKGKNENKLIMDGRFLQQEATGEKKENMPAFKGMGLTGYDNIKKEFSTVWVDNMGTGMMKGSGHYDKAKNAIVEKGTYSCPMTGEKNRTFRSVWKFVDNDHYVYEMYDKDKKGKEFKSLEVAYTRKK